MEGTLVSADREPCECRVRARRWGVPPPRSPLPTLPGTHHPPPTFVVFQLILSVMTLISPTLTPRGTATNTAPATTQAKSSRKAAVRRVSRGCSRASAASGMDARKGRWGEEALID